MRVPHPPPPLPLVLAGARGHGRRHLDNIRRLERTGLVRLAGVCDLTPLTGAELDGFSPSLRQSADFAGLLDATGARAAVVCTPLQTHADLATAAAARGVHLLLEKPPAASWAAHRRVEEAVREAGTACQIGFQALGSHALPAVRALISSGAVGRVRGIGAAGAWVRDAAYWGRAPWAGRRRLGTVEVVDGVLTNALAHAVSTALALADADRAEDVTGVETELLRANDIEADDTSCVRVTTTRGVDVVVAATLCAERPGEPYVLVHGESGRITFWYKQDRVLVQRAGHGPEEHVHGRTDLLENLLAHLADGTELLAPPARSGAFMRVLEAVRTAPDPLPLPPDAWHTAHDTPTPRRVVPGVDGLVAACADTLRLFSETGAAPWTAPSAPSGTRTA
ncbi:Gfo/Idh/MocA family protein [Streptomyces abyssomicinicus]|uniref:Gfo/Idh/MocA family protein n=1 Tax=Streptomyces abyssomicinicus TaxID=574929 RepID=UPI00125078A5|nr:Gfo/Idh/MocA family oxidoreductase [Streptomyces abyssomicinicus]